jgi:RNA polymerase sigma-70 factor (ECF subfamily)
LEREETRRRQVSLADPESLFVERLRDGDRDAHAELCRRFGAAIYGFAASRAAGDEELAEEVMVQTLVDAVRNVRRFNPRRSTLAAWIYGIARRKIQGERRKRRRKKSVPGWAEVSLDTLGERADGGEVGDELAVRLEAQRRVRELSECLSDVEMEVVTMHYVDEFSLREIGQVIGRSEGAVESLLHRAKQKARERMVREDE